MNFGPTFAANCISGLSEQFKLKEALRMQQQFNLTLIGKAVLVSGALLGFLAGPGARVLQANDDCQTNIVKYDHKLHEAIEHHGANSKQADHARHELNNARERCWQANHRWWDEDDHRWHNDRDWDDHDHR
jgi:hypothetical protein